VNSFWQASYVGYFVALGIGLLVGVERERHKGTGDSRKAAGVRTFAIGALLGAVAGQLNIPALMAMGAGAIILLVVASYLLTTRTDPGVTTEIALCLTYFLGILAMSKPQLAGALGVLLALLLVSRSWLHDIALKKLTQQEVLDAILLAAAALIILPLLPNHAVDRFGIINPHVIWRLTVIVMLINASGYVALRTLGAGRGLLLAGFFGGFISSVATIAAMGHRFKAGNSHAGSAVAGAMLSSLATVVQLALLIAATYPTLLRPLGVGLSCMGAVAVLSAVLRARGARIEAGTSQEPGRAFQPRAAVLFAITVTLIFWVAAWLSERFGSLGALIGIAAGGLADTHSAAATAAAMARHGSITLNYATIATLAAITTNTLTKLVAATMSGGTAYLRQLAPALLLMLLGLYAGTWLVLANH
jgi:uncharacterized membrane protein (DUF4010 family)